MPTDTDTTTQAPASPSGAPDAAGSQPMTPSACLTEARARISAEAKADQTAGASGEQTDTGKTGATTEDTDKGETAGDAGKAGKYKTLEEAEKANAEAARKITEQAEEIKRLREGRADTGKAADDANKTTGAKEQGEDATGTETRAGDTDPDLLGDDEILTPEEFDALVEEDPRAAIEYQKRLAKTEAEKAAAPLRAKLAEIEAERAREAASSALGKLESDIDAEHGAGTFATFETKVKDPKHLDKVLADETTREAFLALSEKSPLAAMRMLVREHIAFTARIKAEKARNSHPSDTGTGAGTRSPEIEVKTAADCRAEAARRLGRS